MAQHGDGDDWAYFPIHTIPKSLDVVWCRFPELSPDTPGPKCRPGIVRSVELGRQQTVARIEVCYGTSKLKKDLYPYDLFVENLSQLNLLGLPQATRFELDRTVKLPWAKEFFEPRDGSKTPIIGRLSPYEIGQLETLKRVRLAKKK